MLDGLYPHDTRELISQAFNTEGEQRSLLDVGSGSGAWYVPTSLLAYSVQLIVVFRAVDMALLFPHIKVLGIDFADPRQPYVRSYFFADMSG